MKKQFWKMFIKIVNLYNQLNFWYRGQKIPSTARIFGRIRLMADKGARIEWGENVVINSSWKSNPSGGGQIRCLFRVSSGAKLKIGNNSGISNSTFFCTQSILIGDNVNIGVNCILYDTDMHSVEYESRIKNNNIKSDPIVIENGVWICGHCIILKGVHIGTRSVVAAGSVVTKNIPQDELWGGNPCKFIKKLNTDIGQLSKISF